MDKRCIHIQYEKLRSPTKTLAGNAKFSEHLHSSSYRWERFSQSSQTNEYDEGQKQQ